MIGSYTKEKVTSVDGFFFEDAYSVDELRIDVQINVA